MFTLKKKRTYLRVYESHATVRGAGPWAPLNRNMVVSITPEDWQVSGTERQKHKIQIQVKTGEDRMMTISKNHSAEGHRAECSQSACQTHSPSHIQEQDPVIELLHLGHYLFPNLVRANPQFWSKTMASDFKMLILISATWLQTAPMQTKGSGWMKTTDEHHQQKPEKNPVVQKQTPSAGKKLKQPKKGLIGAAVVHRLGSQPLIVLLRVRFPPRMSMCRSVLGQDT